MANLPAELSTGTVHGRFIIALIDGNDSGQEPDVIPAKGTIRFKSSVPYVPVPVTTLGPVTVMKGPVVGVLDNEGYLCTPNPVTGEIMYRGVKLIATDDPDMAVTDWTWTAEYVFESVGSTTMQIPAHGFALPSDSTVDLTTVVKVPATTGYGLPQAEAAALRAEASATDAITAAESAVTIAQTAQSEAEQSRISAEQAANLVGAPADEVVKTLVEGDTLTNSALAAVVAKGAADFGASDAVQPFLSIINNSTRDAHMLLIGDSTGNETWEWAYLFFQDLASRYPSHTFEYRLWNDSSQSYDPAVAIGTGARKVTLWNASFAGATTQSWQAARVTPAIYDIPADLIMISIGHNEGSGTTYPWAWRARYLSLTESIKAKKPTATMVLVGQNPATANNWQAQRIEVYKEIAARQGYGFIDAHAAFIKAGGNLTIDGIHPNPTGARLWADVMLAAFTRTKAEPRPQQASLITRRTVENKMPNPVFNEWTGVTPSGWTLSNVTAEKVTTGIESGSNAVKLTTTTNGGMMYCNIPVSVVAGKSFTLAVRAKIESGATGLPGRIGFYDNVNSSKLQANGSEPTDGYRWLLHSGSFDAGASTARVYVYAGNAGDIITIDRIILTEGIDPTDAAQLATSTGGGSTGIISTGWVQLTGLTLGAGVTVDNVRVKREGSLVFCHIMNLVIPSDATALTVITGIPSGFRSVSGPSGAVGSTWSLGKLAGNQSPFLQQNMSISNNYIRWEGAQDVRNGTVLTAPTRIDGVMMWNTDDPTPS